MMSGNERHDESSEDVPERGGDGFFALLGGGIGATCGQQDVNNRTT